MPITRRQLAKGAAWSLPVLAVAVAAPLAAASTQPPDEPECLTCTSHSALFDRAVYQDGAILIFTKNISQGAIDVTLRWKDGTPEYHRNYVTQGNNPGDNQIRYVPGEVIVINVHKFPDAWVQIVDCHLKDFS